MIYKVIAALLILSAVLIPAGVIVYAAFNLHPAYAPLILIHIWALNAIYGWIKKLNASFATKAATTGGNEKIGGKEKVVAVIDRPGKKKRISS